MKKINTLFLIDDDDIFRHLASEVILSTQRVNQIKIFANGLDAIKLLKSVQDEPEKLPDVILLDLFMPVLDGWGFLEEYIRLKPLLTKKITIYIVSTSIDPNDIQKARSIPDVKDYIIKPITKEKFLNSMRHLI